MPTSDSPKINQKNIDDLMTLTKAELAEIIFNKACPAIIFAKSRIDKLKGLNKKRTISIG